MNVTLIVNKWIFRYVNERESLWCRVVYAKSGVESILLKTIGTILDRNIRAATTVNGCFHHLVGNGHCTDFLIDNLPCRYENLCI